MYSLGHLEHQQHRGESPEAPMIQVQDAAAPGQPAATRGAERRVETVDGENGTQHGPARPSLEGSAWQRSSRKKKKVSSPGKKKNVLSSRPFRFASLSSLLLPQPTCTLRHVTSAHRSASIQPSGWPVESISLCLNYSSWPDFSHGSFASCILYARTHARTHTLRTRLDASHIFGSGRR